MIYRNITPTLKHYATQFSVVGVMGPRQSGKTTLAKETFPDYHYLSLENLDTRRAAKEDPKFFLSSYKNKLGVIIDEIQEVPELLSYMQGIVDEEYRPGFFIITGSQHFLLYEKITQTLAGRIGLLTLLPLSVSELAAANLLPDSLDELLVKGFYPQTSALPIDYKVWQDNYISTYLERDVRQVINITDLFSFQLFIRLAAARVGNLLNFSELARDCNIAPNTAKAWFSILNTSFVCNALFPYFRNFNKRIIKSPKLYFFDTGLICFLLGIKTADDLIISPFRGAIFENFVISEIYKYYYEIGKRPEIFFWRDSQGLEIDCILEKAVNDITAIEIKSGMTIQPNFFDNLEEWQKITQETGKTNYLIYGGKEEHKRKFADVIGWDSIRELVQKIV